MASSVYMSRIASANRIFKMLSRVSVVGKENISKIDKPLDGRFNSSEP